MCVVINNYNSLKLQSPHYRKFKMATRLIIYALIGLILGCSKTSTSILISDDYDEESDKTTQTIIPYGHIEFPGQWTKTKYNEESRQHFFIDKDSTSIAVAKNPQEKYPFYTEGMTDKEFTRKFFEWEKGFYEKRGFEITELKNYSGENFIVWKVTRNKANTVLLYGSKEHFAYNFAVFTDNWTNKDKIEFVRNLFEQN